MALFEILCGLVVLSCFIYYFFFAHLNFWKNRGVEGPKPHLLFGNVKDTMLVRISISQFIKKLYDDFHDEPMIGIFARNTPILIVKDPDLIKDVLIKDFTNFVNRGMKVHDKVEPLSQHLFFLEPKRWRPLRTKLSPVFTSGKLKEMFYILKECTEYFDEMVGTLVQKEEPIEVRDLFAKFTTDVIGACAFGLNMKSNANEDSEFRRMGKKIFDFNFFRVLKFRIKEALPWLYDMLGPIFYETEINDFFINSIKQTMEHREKENIVRHDFIDLLRDLKNNPEKMGDIEMTDSLLAAQAFVFFLAGFETSSTTMGHMVYELAQNHAIQDKLREEVMDTLKKCNGDLTYEGIKGMKYMHQVFQETLRMYSPVAMLMRESDEPYTFSGTNVTIPGKTKVWIPVHGIHLDAKIYPNPQIFDPQRFAEGNIKSRHPMYHLPFGDGPRNCIGARFAVYQVKIGISKLLQNYKVDVCDKTEIPYIPKASSFLLVPKNGISLKITKLDQSKK